MPVGVIVAIAPVRIPTPIAIVVGVAPIPVPAPIGTPVGTVTPAPVVAWVVVPIEGVIAVHVDVGVATATDRVIIVVVVSRRRGLCAETLDAGGKVGVIIGLSGGVHYAVRVGHRLRGLVNGISVVDVVLAVGIVGLVVVFRVAADAGAHVRTVAGSHPTACVAVRRIIGVVFGRLAIRRAADEGHKGNDRKYSECFHCIEFYFVVLNKVVFIAQKYTNIVPKIEKIRSVLSLF